MSEPLRIAPKLLTIEHEAQSPNGRGRFYLRAPAEHTSEQVLAPEYFGSCSEGAKRLRECDLIEVEAQDRSWELTLTVLSVSASARRVVTRLKGEVARYETALAHEHVAAGYALKYVGAASGWGVFLGAELIEHGFATQTRAAERLTELAPSRSVKTAA